MDKISIVLPVYNGEDYLTSCLESIKNQSFDNFEVIMIDDCSTDSSTEILKRYEKNDSRFIYYRNKSNSGLSFSRNFGMSKCSGCYLSFIDADDVLNINCLEKLFNAIEKNQADISICGFKMFSGDIDIKESEAKEIVLNNQELMKELALCVKIQNFAWGKLYKRELFKGIEFPSGRYYEDICTTPLVFGRVAKGVYVSDELYYYRQNPNSISKTLNLKKICDFFLSMEEKAKYFLDNYEDILKYMSQSFFDLLLLRKEYKIKKSDIPNYSSAKHLYKLAVKKASFKQKLKYFWAIL